VIKQEFRFQKARLRGMLKSVCKVNVLAALKNLLRARNQLQCRSCAGKWCPVGGKKHTKARGLYKTDEIRPVYP